MKNKSLSIQVRKVAPGHTVYDSSAPYEVVGTIKRKCWSEVIGNFNPVFCRYQKKRTLVHSEKGDLSDPFRANQSYLETLFIRIS